MESAGLSAGAVEIVRRINTRMVWIEMSRAALTDALGVQLSTLQAALALGSGYGDPKEWGRRGGRLSLRDIARCLDLPPAALEEAGYAEHLVDGWSPRPPRDTGSKWLVRSAGVITQCSVDWSPAARNLVLTPADRSRPAPAWIARGAVLPHEWPVDAQCSWPARLWSAARSSLEEVYRSAAGGHVLVERTPAGVRVQAQCTCKKTADDEMPAGFEMPCTCSPTPVYFPVFPGWELGSLESATRDYLAVLRARDGGSN